MRFTHGVMRFARRDEVGGNEPRALVQQLEKRMLRVGAGRAPDDGPGVVIHRFAVTRDALAAGLHIELLQVGGQERQRFVVRQDGVRRGAEKVVVPDAEQREYDRHAALECRVAEMRVHLARALQELVEVIHARRQRHRQADR